MCNQNIKKQDQAIMAVKIITPKIPPTLVSSDDNTKNMLLTSEKEKIAMHTNMKVVMIKFYRLIV
jgi:hypothetical protein